MNIYKFHNNATSLNHHNLSHNHVPYIVWKDSMPERWYKEREDIWAKDADSAFMYVRHVINAPFPKGEDAIAKDGAYSFWYVKDILKTSFAKGEDVIAKDAVYSFLYARDILDARFAKGEAALAKLDKNNYYRKTYEDRFGVNLDS